MKTEYLIIRPNEYLEAREVDLPAEPNLEELQAITGPFFKWIERVSVPSPVGWRDMLVDEEGWIGPKAELNPRASRISGQRIAGTAILFNRRVWF